MYQGDNLQEVYNSTIHANAVHVKPDDIDAVLFENIEILSGETGISAYIDVSSDKDKTLFVKSTKDLAIYVQLTDDVNEWYDLCDATGTVVTFICNNASKAIPISIKALYMRVLVKNNDSSADTPYVGVT